MTASVAALGLIPLQLATGPTLEVQRPLAIIVIRGLIASTLVMLIVLLTGFAPMCRQIWNLAKKHEKTRRHLYPGRPSNR